MRQGSPFLLYDILPPDLITLSKDAAALLADLQSRNERMFLLTFTVINTASTRQRLDNDYQYRVNSTKAG